MTTYIKSVLYIVIYKIRHFSEMHFVKTTTVCLICSIIYKYIILYIIIFMQKKKQQQRMLFYCTRIILCCYKIYSFATFLNLEVLYNHATINPKHRKSL